MNRSSKNRKSHFLPILAAIFLVVIVWASFCLGKKIPSNQSLNNAVIPTPNSTSIGGETSDWNKFSDNVLSLRYPTEWSTGETQVFGSRIVVEFRYNNNPLFTISEIGNHNNGSGKAYTSLAEYIGPTRITKATDIKIGNYQAMHIVSPGEAGHVLPYEEIVFFNSDKTLLVSMYYEQSYYDKKNSDQVLSKIISTLTVNP